MSHSAAWLATRQRQALESACRSPSIHAEHRAGDVLRGVREKVNSQRGDLFRRHQVAEWDAGKPTFDVTRDPSDHGSIGEAGCEDVDPDASLGEFQRESLRCRVQTRLRGDVGESALAGPNGHR